MNYLKEMIRGMIIGIANVIPGVSGGTMAVSMGIYGKIIFAITNIRKDVKGSIRTLLPYVLGAAIGIIVLSFLIEKLFADFPIPTTMLFLGLILGGVPTITKKVENEKFKWTHLVSFILFIAIIILPCILSASANDVVITNIDFMTVVILFVVGVIAAGTMVVPGVSGSMILMMLGFYEPIIQTINNFIKGALSLDFTSMLTNIGILLPFGVGILLGIVITAKIIERLLKRYPNATYWGILGLVVASPFAILYGINLSSISIYIVLASIITLASGYIISNKLSSGK